MIPIAPLLSEDSPDFISLLAFSPLAFCQKTQGQVWKSTAPSRRPSSGIKLNFTQRNGSPAPSVLFSSNPLLLNNNHHRGRLSLRVIYALPVRRCALLVLLLTVWDKTWTHCKKKTEKNPKR